MTKKVAVLGAGSWGTALAMVLADNGHQAVLWSIQPRQVEEINKNHSNKAYLPDVELDSSIQATSDLAEAVEDADFILFVLPTAATRSVAKDLATVLKEPTTIIHATKGLEQETYKRISEVLTEELPPNLVNGFVVLSGPSHAEEVAVKDLTTITSASYDTQAAKQVQDLFSNDYFRVYTHDDVIGVELGGALKNIIALGAGALVGLGLGDNAKAALITRGLWEMARFGVAAGGKNQTFTGLSGLGDLIVTATSPHSRNWRAGKAIAEGQSLAEVEENMGMVIEGVKTTKAAYEQAQQYGIEMPITEAIYSVLYEGVSAEDAISSLMQRDKKEEFKYES